MESVEKLDNQLGLEKNGISEKEISKLAKDFKKMVLKGAAGAMTVPVAIVLSTGIAATAAYFALRNKESISGEVKKTIMDIGNTAEKITQKAFDKIGIENPFKEKMHFGQGRSGGGGANGEF